MTKEYLLLYIYFLGVVWLRENKVWGTVHASMKTTAQER